MMEQIEEEMKPGPCQDSNNDMESHPRTERCSPTPTPRGPAQAGCGLGDACLHVSLFLSGGIGKEQEGLAERP